MKVVVGAALAVAMLGLPAAANATSYLGPHRTHWGTLGDEYEAYGAGSSVTLRVLGKGNPLLTGDNPGAQRVEVSDPDQPITAEIETPGTGWCIADSTHRAHCDSDWYEQANYNTSSCYYPPGCTGPGPTGLILWFAVDFSTAHGSLHDVAGDTPLPVTVDNTNTTAGTRDVELWSAESLTYRFLPGYNAANTDRVVIHPGVGASTIDLGPGDDMADTRNGVADSVTCGDGDDTVRADSADSVAADCETVRTGGSG